MKRLLVTGLATLLLGLFVFPFATATAEDVLAGPCAKNPNAAACQDRDQSVRNNGIFGENGIFVKATNLLSYVAGIAAVVVIIVGGLQYITSSGDPAKINTAKNMILFAIIGLVVIILARVIISLVVGRL